jgi:hypothetical protein
MIRTNAIVLGTLMVAACTELNVKPHDAGPLDAPVDVLDGPIDVLDDVLDAGGMAGAGGLAGNAGSSAGGNAGAPASDVGGAGGAGGRAGAAGAAGAGGLAQSGGRGGAAGAVAGSAGRGGGGGGRGGGPGGGTAGHGGATATCPATTANPCTPNMTDTAEEACCTTGKRTRSRKCDPVTCQWGSYSDWSSCAGVQAVCTPGDKTACTNSDPCGNRVCTNACAWGDCVPKTGNACLCVRNGTNCGSNYRCGTGSHAGQWQFCLSATCQWSTDWADCSPENCEC